MATEFRGKMKKGRIKGCGQICFFEEKCFKEILGGIGAKKLGESEKRAQLSVYFCLRGSLSLIGGDGFLPARRLDPPPRDSGGRGLFVKQCKDKRGEEENERI